MQNCQFIYQTKAPTNSRSLNLECASVCIFLCMLWSPYALLQNELYKCVDTFVWFKNLTRRNYEMALAALDGLVRSYVTYIYRDRAFETVHACRGCKHYLVLQFTMVTIGRTIPLISLSLLLLHYVDGTAGTFIQFRFLCQDYIMCLVWEQLWLAMFN